MDIWTVGHSTRRFPEFVELLRAHGIEHLVDVRRYPGSRRHPQFSKESLAAGLRAAGIGYVHEPDLGGRRPTSADSPNTAWRNASFRGYADHMSSDAFAAALGRILDLAADRRVALMCAEAVPWRCHRNLIADALVARGVRVLHILSAGRADVHALHPAAVTDGEHVTYPAAGPQLELG